MKKLLLASAIAIRLILMASVLVANSISIKSTPVKDLSQRPPFSTNPLLLTLLS